MTNDKGEPTADYYPVSHLTTASQKFKELNPSAKVLYFYLCKIRNYYADEQGIFYRSDRILIRDTGLSQYSITHAKKELIKNKFLRWKQGNFEEACKYQIADIEK